MPIINTFLDRDPEPPDWFCYCHDCAGKLTDADNTHETPQGDVICQSCYECRIDRLELLDDN